VASAQITAACDATAARAATVVDVVDLAVVGTEARALFVGHQRWVIAIKKIDYLTFLYSVIGLKKPIFNY